MAAIVVLVVIRAVLGSWDALRTGGEPPAIWMAWIVFLALAAWFAYTFFWAIVYEAWTGKFVGALGYGIVMLLCGGIAYYLRPEHWGLLLTDAPVLPSLMRASMRVSPLPSRRVRVPIEPPRFLPAT